jgi:hypothetical protein
LHDWRERLLSLHLEIRNRNLDWFYYCFADFISSLVYDFGGIPIMRLLVIFLSLSLTCCGQVSLKGSVVLKGSVSTGTAAANLGCVPAGVGWHELASTIQVNACVATAHALTNCTSGANFAYSGMVPDSTGSRLVLLGGGGHTDGTDPNAYALNCSTSTPSWAAITSYSGTTANDCNNFGGAAVQVSGYPPNNVPSCTATTATQGTVPSSSHTYVADFYSPSQDAFYKMIEAYTAWGNPGLDKSIWKITGGGSAWSLVCDNCGHMGQVTGII